MKLATAPTAGLPERSAAVSAPTSKSCVCTRTKLAILTACYRRKNRHFVARLDRMFDGHYVLIHGDAKRARRG